MCCLLPLSDFHFSSSLSSLNIKSKITLVTFHTKTLFVPLVSLLKINSPFFTTPELLNRLFLMVILRLKPKLFMPSRPPSSLITLSYVLDFVPSLYPTTVLLIVVIHQLTHADLRK